MVRPALLAATVIVFAAGAGTADAKTWTTGQTATVAARSANPGQPAYRISVKVPAGMTFGSAVTGTTLGRKSVTYAFKVRKPTVFCFEHMIDTADPPSLTGTSIADALRDAPFDGRQVATGRGAGGSRWVHFKSEFGGKASHTFYAIAPNVSAPSVFEDGERAYYGVSLNDGCMTREAAGKIIRAVRITPA